MTGDDRITETFSLLGSLAAVVASAGGPWQGRALAVSRLLKEAESAIVHRRKSLQDVLLDIRRGHLGPLIDPDSAPTRAERPSAKRRDQE